jgi:hypothetical protein
VGKIAFERLLLPTAMIVYIYFVTLVRPATPNTGHREKLFINE